MEGIHCRTRIALLLLFVCNVFGDSNSLLNPRAPGDSIYKNCKDIPVASITTIKNVCVELKEGADCGLDVTLSAAGNQVISKNLEMGIVPRACGRYSAGGGLIPCELCVSLDQGKTPGEMCLNISPTCASTTIATVPAGCFQSTLLDGIRQCQARTCPNRCSGHGTCDNGVCTCSPGYYTKDCSSTDPTWEVCQQVQQVGGDVCTRVKFKDCKVTTQLLLIPGGGGGMSVPIIDKSYPVTEFKAVFQDTCSSAFGCDTCLKWNNLVLNTTHASGCGNIAFTCFGFNYADRNLGCFSSPKIAECLGSCPSACSGYGECTRGYCKCVSGWTGEDCSEKASVCPNECSSHGRCSSKGCECTNDWGGKDCSLYIGNGDTSSPTGTKAGGKKSVAAMILVPTTVICIVGVIAVLLWFTVIKKRVMGMSSSHAFNQMDLLEEEDTSVAQELDEDVK